MRRESWSPKGLPARSIRRAAAAPPRLGTGSARKGLSAALALALAGGFLVGVPSSASADVDAASALVINEVYPGGGNVGAVYNADYVELYNKGATSINLSTYSLQYSAAAGTNWSSKTTLTGSIAAGSYYLARVSSVNATNGIALPVTPNHTATNINIGGNGNIALVSNSAQLTCAAAACASDDSVVDLVAMGNALAFPGTAAAPNPAAESASRDNVSTNTADNAADFTSATPTPGAATAVVPTVPVPMTIPEIQGTAAASPAIDALVTTSGVVTAAYPAGGFFGYTLQVPGSGDSVQPASQAIFVYQPSEAVTATVGQHLEVTGFVSEFSGLTQLTVAAADVEVLDVAAPVTPLATDWPNTDEARESLESMLLAPTGDFTITNTFSTNQYGEVGLAAGTTPLLQPTDVAPPGAAADAIATDNAGRAVVLDDGSSINYLAAANTNLTPPFISLTTPIRVGASATLNQPVILDYRNNNWKFQPTAQVTDSTAGSFVTFENTRADAPTQADLGGDLRVASFNVLNYFTTVGNGILGCTSFNDRDGDGVTVNSCPGNGPRGAWDVADLDRQQAKIVAAINELDSSVVGLMEIENSAVLGEDADEAVTTLVAALNEAAGSTKWAVVASSADLPPVSEMDVISNAIIYQPALVTPLDAAKALGTLSAPGAAFDNAREPLGQAFSPVGGGDPFFVAVNHFKSKSTSGAPATGSNANGAQGAWNGDRIDQATALRDWIPTVLDDYTETPVEDVFLIGDFNSYTQEDPLQVLYENGYTNLAPADQYSYSFSGLSGSLDHVLANASAAARVQGTEIWNINAPESLALEYSRYNYQGTLFYEPTPYRSSDHDPVVAGFNAAGPATSVDINLLNINDFHGRIDTNTVKFAGTVEQLRTAIGDANTLFLSAGDNIGASLFASSVAQDQPTIDVLNALDLNASAVGNHEFDQGFDDLVDRVIDGGTNAQWDYLGANVYLAGTETPALDEYSLFQVSGLTVAVVGAVTEETPTLVTPGGISALDFGDPVEAVNRVAAQLSDGDEGNGEADIIVAEYHEGAGEGIPDGATLEQEVAQTGTAFSRIVTETSAEVDAIFNGHTHKQYAWDAPVPGVVGRTRPIVQTGSYGEFIGQIVLTYDTTTGEVTSYTRQNVARSTVADDTLVSTYPRVAQVKSVVDAAIANAATVGNTPVGSVTADITTAYSGGSYVSGVYTGSGPLANSGRDDRSKESTLGNLVANSLVDTLSDPDRGGATIGVVNPGGLRNELYQAPDGVINYAEANAVLPFVNNLWTVDLTGSQFKTMLEQQWQTDANGNTPSRPYLALGLSNNVSYTYDNSAAAGSRVTSVTIDGAPLNAVATYRVGTFSFLAEGGDNFRIFKNSTNVRDSGLIDRDAWIQYITDNSPLSPDFARHAVGISGLDYGPTAGEALTFTASGLDLTSLGSPANATLTVNMTLGSASPVEIGTATVTNGTATVSAIIPAAARGAATITITADPSGTVATLPLIDVKAPGTFNTLEPARVLDTAMNVGASANIPAKGSITLQLTGRGGIPAVGVASVELNLQAVTPAAAGYLTLHAAGTTRPSTSNLNFTAGKSISTLAVAPISATGEVTIYNSSNAALRVIGDIAGYFRTGVQTDPGSFTSLAPTRILDTSSSNGAAADIPARGTITLQIGGRGGVPAADVASALVNLQAVKPTSAGYLTLYTEATRPSTSNLNFTVGTTISSLVVAPLSATGTVTIYNGSNAPIRVIADLAGYYLGGTAAVDGAFQSLAPSRLLDTLLGNGATANIPAKGSITLQVSGRGGLPATGVDSVVLNLQAVTPGSAGYLTLHEAGTSRPTASNLNFTVGTTISTLAVASVSASGAITIYNGSKSEIRVIADAAGYNLQVG